MKICYTFKSGDETITICSRNSSDACIAYEFFHKEPADFSMHRNDDLTEKDADIVFEVFEDMRDIKDSLQFDSGTSICRLRTNHGEAYIDVKGYVNVGWCPEGFSSGASCDIYRYPSEFPAALKSLIASGADISSDDRVYISENNWFEIFFGDDGCQSDVVDIEGSTNKELLTQMYESIEEAYEEGGHKRAALSV